VVMPHTPFRNAKRSRHKRLTKTKLF
jgi:hypothetical protein